jgi:hypothetical protein
MNVLFLVMVLTLSGCNELTSTPEKALGKAYSAIQQQDLEKFVSVLEADALVQYGNREGMEQLGGKLGHQDVLPAEPILLSEKDLHCGTGCLKIEYFYSVDVLSKHPDKAGSPDHRLLGTTVRCLKWRTMPEPKMPTRTQCKISEIHL